MQFLAKSWWFVDDILVAITIFWRLDCLQNRWWGRSFFEGLTLVLVSTILCRRLQIRQTTPPGDHHTLTRSDISKRSNHTKEPRRQRIINKTNESKRRHQNLIKLPAKISDRVSGLGTGSKSVGGSNYLTVRCIQFFEYLVESETYVFVTKIRNTILY